MGCCFTCFFLTTNASAHTLILPRHTHTGLSSRENPHSTVALQKLINVPIRGISRPGSHCKAGVSGGEGWEPWAPVPRWQRWDRGGKPRFRTQQGPALPLPCRTLCTGLGNVLLNPLCLLQPHWRSRKHQDQHRSYLMVSHSTPTQLQPCSAYGIQLRDQGSRFHLIHPQNHQVRGFQVTAHWLETEPGQGGGAASRSSPGTGQTRDSRVSISARTPHASKKGFSLFSFLPAQKSQRREGPVTPLTAFLLISFSMSELAGSQLT